VTRDAEIGGRVVSRLIAELAEQEEAAVRLFDRLQESEKVHAAQVAELEAEIARLKEPAQEPPAGVLAVAK
jgi:rubrerythrin